MPNYLDRVFVIDNITTPGASYFSRTLSILLIRYWVVYDRTQVSKVYCNTFALLFSKIILLVKVLQNFYCQYTGPIKNIEENLFKSTFFFRQHLIGMCSNFFMWNCRLFIFSIIKLNINLAFLLTKYAIWFECEYIRVLICYLTCESIWVLVADHLRGGVKVLSCTRRNRSGIIRYSVDENYLLVSSILYDYKFY